VRSMRESAWCDIFWGAGYFSCGLFYFSPLFSSLKISAGTYCCSNDDTRAPASRRDRAQIFYRRAMLLDSRHTVKDAEGKAVGVRMMCPCCLSNSYTKLSGGWSKVRREDGSKSRVNMLTMICDLSRRRWEKFAFGLEALPFDWVKNPPPFHHFLCVCLR